MQAYPAYKETNLDWLGRIPSHWRLGKLGACFAERNEKVSDTDYAALSVTKNGIVPQMEHVAKTDAGDNRKKVCKNDFVINSRSDRKGSAGVSELDGSVSLISTVLEPRFYLPRFAHHLFRSYNFQEEFYRFGKGIVADLWSTRYAEMKNIVVPLIPENEQEAIANFLNRETARIDNLIAEKKTFINLLKEKRQALISHVVTKGLDPNVKMKDSGIEWIGEVPEGWSIVPLKYLCSFSGGGTPSKDNLDYWNGAIPWVSPKDMKSFWISDSKDKITEEAITNSSTSIVEPGAVLMVVRSGILQRTIPIGINTVPVSLNQDMKALAFDDENLALFFSYFVQGFTSSLLIEWCKQGTTVESIEFEYLSRTYVPVPEKNEQKIILECLENETAKLDNIVAETHESIRLLIEHRTALISAAVTGKIDVRNYKEVTEIMDQIPLKEQCA